MLSLNDERKLSIAPLILDKFYWLVYALVVKVHIFSALEINASDIVIWAY